MTSDSTEEGPPRRRRPLLTRRDVVRAGLEVILIVLSVLLALWVDQWREDREVRRRVAEATTYLADEIRTNRRQLLHPVHLPYHRTNLAETTGMLQRNDGAAVVAFEREFGGVHPFFAQDVVWRSVEGELTARMPPGRVFRLARAYDAQRQLAELHRAFFAKVNVPSVDADNPAYLRSKVDVIRSYFADVVPAEERLLELYADALRDLEGTAAPDAISSQRPRGT